MSIEVIILLVVLMVLALVSPLFSPFSRKPTLPKDYSKFFDLNSHIYFPPVSIIITVHDNAYQLSHIIDSFLTQDYPQDYQVIVVVDENDHLSLDVLKQKEDNPHLYYTKLPITSRYLSRKKLAMTVGIRASKYDWCIITSVYCTAPNDQWLKAFCRHVVVGHGDTNLIIGMTPYEQDTPLFWRYEHLRTMLYHLTSAEHNTAFSTNQLLVALRKEEFFKQQGFSGNLEYQRAEFEFLVNKFARRGGTSIALEPSAWLPCKRPTPKQWYYRHMHGIDSFHAMKHSTAFRMLYHLDLWVMHLFNLLTIMAFIAGLVLLVMGNMLWGILLIVLPPVFWTFSQYRRKKIYKPVLKYFDNVNPFRAIVYDWRMSLSNLMIRVRYKFTDRYDFMTHRL